MLILRTINHQLAQMRRRGVQDAHQKAVDGVFDNSDLDSLQILRRRPCLLHAFKLPAVDAHDSKAVAKLLDRLRLVPIDRHVKARIGQGQHEARNLMRVRTIAHFAEAQQFDVVTPIKAHAQERGAISTGTANVQFDQFDAVLADGIKRGGVLLAGFAGLVDELRHSKGEVFEGAANSGPHMVEVALDLVVINLELGEAGAILCNGEDVALGQDVAGDVQFAKVALALAQERGEVNLAETCRTLRWAQCWRKRSMSRN